MKDSEGSLKKQRSNPDLFFEGSSSETSFETRKLFSLERRQDLSFEIDAKSNHYARIYFKHLTLIFESDLDPKFVNLQVSFFSSSFSSFLFLFLLSLLLNGHRNLNFLWL
jgi:hypothetical protein